MDPEHIALLQAMPVFGGIRADNLELLLRHADVVEQPKGSYFFRENDKASSMYVLETGEVAILKAWQGHEYLLKRLAVGDCFGEMELIDLEPRSASARAEVDCRALALTAGALQKLYKVDPHQFAMIHMNMGREVARRLREMDRRIFELLGKDALELGR
jgi:CRP-like cAMP-binding protein